MKSFKIQLRRRNVPDEEILQDLKRAAKELSKKTITKNEYDEKGEFGATTILRRFKKWNIALEKAGLEAPNRQHVPDEELFENLAEVWRKLGRQPFGRELEKAHGYSKFSLGTYENRFGSWNKSLIAFETFIQSGEIAEQSEKRSKSLSGMSKRTNRKINWRMRAQILIRDNCICKMCGASPSRNPNVVLHVDHVKPWAKGGETVLENLQTLCSKCNIGKSDISD